MDISLQAYRIRIGNFNPTIRIKNAKEQVRSWNKDFKWNYLVIIVILVSFIPWPVAMPYCTSQEGTRSIILNPPWAFPSSASTRTFPSGLPLFCRRSRSPCSQSTASTSPPWRIRSPNLAPLWSTTHYPHLYLRRTRSPTPITPWITPPWPSSVPPASPWTMPTKTRYRRSHKRQNKTVKALNGNRGQRGHGIKLAHWNKGPSFLQNSHQDIQTVIEDHHPHLLGLSEANLKSSHDLALVQHRDYQLHICATVNNPSLEISRVVVYTHQSLIVKRRPDLDDDTISAIWLEVGLPRHKKIIICQAYREWGYLGQGRGDTSGTMQAQLDRWIVFLDKWERALQEGKEVIVMMDANLDFLKWNQDDLPAADHTRRLKPLIQELFTRIFPLGVSQLVNTPTRFWGGHVQSGLDHVYSNKPDKLSPVEAKFIGMSDHKILKVTRYSKSLKKNVRYIRKRSFKNFNPAEFCMAVQELSWWDLYMTDDATQAACLLTNKLTNILDRLAPVKTFQVRNKYAPWLSESTKTLIKERNDAQKVAAESKHPEDWNKFKNLRNTVKSKSRKEKQLWEEGKLNSAENTPSILWQNIKGWLNWKNSGPPSQLFYLGEVINSPAQLACTMNRFFIDKVTKLRSQIPDSSSDPLAKLRESMASRECSMRFKPAKPEEVLKIIMGLKNSKSSGIDNINTTVLKLVAKDILPAVTHIINQSLSQSSFPSIWKHSKVIPLLKKDDPLSPKNYRPVALLPILSKVLEKVVFLQLVEYLDAHKLLHPNHHGSRHSHNTATALIQMYDQWIDEMEDGKMVGLMMIDLSAAFDMVDHQLLLEKLSLFGLEGEVLEWMKSYLEDRKQSVCIDGSMSPPLHIRYGVPQGSILGPLLYIIFTNDIPDLVHKHPICVNEPLPYCGPCGSTVSYVDDCTFSYGDRDPHSLSNELENQYSKISEYMAANKLVINSDKTQLVVVGSRQVSDLRNQVRLQADQHLIVPAPTAKLLGGVVSQDGKWKHHILSSDQSLIKQITSRINGLCLISPRASFHTRLMVANGIVISKLCYLIQLWGGCQGYLLDSLQVLQTRAARIVCKQTWFTPTRVLLTRCRWLSVRQLVYYQTAILTYKIMKSGLPVYLGDKMITEFPYRTRQATSGAIRYGEEYGSRRSLNHSSFRIRATVEYNKLPGNIRQEKTLKTFKTKLKQWVKDNIPMT